MAATVVIIVFVSFGCFILLGCCLFALCFFLMKKKKKRESEQKTEVIRDDEHFKVKEDIMEGPRGKESVITMEKDKHFEERISKNEKVSGEIDVEAGHSSANHHVHYKQ